MMLAHCLITGIRSQLGLSLSSCLAQNADNYVVTRNKQFQLEHVNCIALDIEKEQLMFPAAVNSLLHLAPIFLLPHLIAQANQQQKKLRIIAISSCSVTAKQNSPSAAEQYISQRLLEAEYHSQQLAQEGGHQLTILRPTMLYGIGLDKTIGRLQAFIHQFSFLPLPVINFGLRQPVHVDDVVQAIKLCLNTEKTVGNTYEIGGSEQLSIRQIANKIFQHNHKRVIIVPIPTGLMRMAIYFLSWIKPGLDWNSALIARAENDQLADNLPAEQDFNYQPRKFDGRFNFK